MFLKVMGAMIFASMSTGVRHREIKTVPKVVVGKMLNNLLGMHQSSIKRLPLIIVILVQPQKNSELCILENVCILIS